METSSPAPQSSYPSNNDPDTARLERWLPALLSAVAGTVDVIGFLSLKLFSAHVTGNLVVMAALLVRGGPPNVNQILAVPVFILAVGCVWTSPKRSADVVQLWPDRSYWFIPAAHLRADSERRLWFSRASQWIHAQHRRHGCRLRDGLPILAVAPRRAGRAVDGCHDRQPDEDRLVFAGRSVAKAGCTRRQKPTEKDPAAYRSILMRLSGRCWRTLMAGRLGLVPSRCACRHGADPGTGEQND